MNHFRDRVVITPGNIPQLPSGKRAVVNVPGITQIGQASTSLTALIVSITSIDCSADLGALIPTQTKTATSP